MAKSVPASRVERLLARIADNVLYMVPILMISNETLLSEFTALIGAAILACIVIVQVALLTQEGQTVGKKLFKVKIVLLKTKKNGGFVSNVLLRSVCNMILGLIPLYGLVDVLFIFRKDQRCIHDWIAKTVVVKA